MILAMRVELSRKCVIFENVYHVGRKVYSGRKKLHFVKMILAGFSSKEWLWDARIIGFC